MNKIRAFQLLQLAGVLILLVGVAWRVGEGVAADSTAPMAVILLGVLLFAAGRIAAWLAKD